MKAATNTDIRAKTAEAVMKLSLFESPMLMEEH